MQTLVYGRWQAPNRDHSGSALGERAATLFVLGPARNLGQCKVWLDPFALAAWALTTRIALQHARMHERCVMYPIFPAPRCIGLGWMPRFSSGADPLHGCIKNTLSKINFI